jgi:murein DD-endopeptidase MepM/ murein hydrolase activator NlpD
MGRMVRLRHERGLETFYGHLDRVASGVRSGARVRQGQVIGYVGSTGLATGDHLHYAVRQGGRFVNPLGVGSVRAAALAPADRLAFAEVRDSVRRQLGRLGDAPGPVVVSRAPSLDAEG